MKKLIILSLLFLSNKSFADYVDDGDEQYYGTIINITKSKILLKENCTGVIKEFKWNQQLIVFFNSQCLHPDLKSSRLPIVTGLNCPKEKFFTFSIKNSNQMSFAESFQIQHGKLYITYAKGKGSKVYSCNNLFQYIEWVNYITICDNDIPNNFTVL